MMGGLMKLLDVRRDPRIAVHSPTLEPPKGDPSGWPGDAKLAGTLIDAVSPLGTPHEGAGFFKIDQRRPGSPCLKVSDRAPETGNAATTRPVARARSAGRSDRTHARSRHCQ